MLRKRRTIKREVPGGQNHLVWSMLPWTLEVRVVDLEATRLIDSPLGGWCEYWAGASNSRLQLKFVRRLMRSPTLNAP